MVEMIPHNLTAENYFFPENNMKYMSCSQFKSFLACEAQALAELKGEHSREVTDALLVGSYVDAHFERTLDIFKAHHPELFTKSGSLKAQYNHAEYMIQRVERDEKFMQYMSGEKQKIFVGEIEEVPFKIKVDSYHNGAVVDLKCVKDFLPVWNDKKKRKDDFITHWGYLYQGAIYTEIVRQNTGITPEFYIAAVTKEKEPDIDIFHVDRETLDESLQEVKSLVHRFQSLKRGELQPQRCGRCAYCRATKILKAPRSFRELKEVFEVE